MKKLTIIIPAHNEEKRIRTTLDRYSNFFNKNYKNKFEILIIPNGCKDNTVKIVREYSKKYKFIKYKNIIEPLGDKGKAVIMGFKKANSELIGFVDADNSTTAEAFFDLVKTIGDYDGIIASRWIKGSIVEPKQTIKRRIASRVFNLFVRILFGLNLIDTQCGAKLFKKEAIKKVAPKIGITKWAFDIDLLYQLKRAGYKVKEIPTVWKDTPDSKLNLKKVSVEMFLAIIRLRLIYSPFKFIVTMYNKIFPKVLFRSKK